MMQTQRPWLLPLAILYLLTLTAAEAAAQEPQPPAAPVEPSEPPPPTAAPEPPTAAPEQPAPAEPEPEATTVSSADVNQLGEVVISARRRQETAQEVPVAITALSGAALEAKGVVNLETFHKEIPSVTSYSLNQRNTTINIRGLGTGVALTGSGLDSGVGFYVDDVYYGRLSQSILDLVDLDHIEVLRGPQGTLFGRNTTAGAISVVTREPTFSLDGSADLSVGNYGYLQGRTSLSGPIIANKLAARVSMEAQTRQGFLKDVYTLQTINDQRSFTVRGQLLFTPTEKLKLRLIADYAEQAQACCITTPTEAVTKFDNGGNLPYTFAQRIANFDYSPLKIDPRARLTDVDRQRVFRVTLGGVSLRGDWDLDSHTLTSISAFRFWNTGPRNDGDNTALDVYREGNQDDRQRQFTQELRVASNGKKTIDYVLGLYFLYQSLPNYQRNDYGPQAGEFLIAPGTSDLSPEQRRDALNGAYTRGPSVANTLNGAAFGQGTLHILAGLDFTAGLRYTYERKYGHFEQWRASHIDDSELNDAQIALRNSYTPTVPYYSLDKSWNSFSALATLSQKLGEDALIFATYSRGSKSGGLNLTVLPKDAQGNSRTDLAILKPEIVDHLELGLKSQWLDHRLTANVNVFQTQIRDYQNTIADQSGSTWIWYLSNVGKVRSRGVELEVRATPFKQLSLYGGATYNLAEYVSYKNAQCPYEQRAPGLPGLCDLSGQQLPVAPKYSAAAGGTLTLELSRKLSFFASGDFNYRSSYATSTNLSRYSRIDGVALVNARLGLRDNDGRWEALLWSRNLFDSLYYLYKTINEQTGIVSGLLGEPRMFGATVRYYFD